MTTNVEVYQAKDYKSELKPIWCPGCGDFGVVQAIYRALASVGRPPHEIAFVSGIGCSSRIPGYTTGAAETCPGTAGGDTCAGSRPELARQDAGSDEEQ